MGRRRRIEPLNNGKRESQMQEEAKEMARWKEKMIEDQAIKEYKKQQLAELEAYDD